MALLHRARQERLQERRQPRAAVNAGSRLAALLQAFPPWEAAAVLLALAYLLLAIRQNPWCWPAAIASASIYVVLMFRAGLYLQSGLQVFYVAIAVYGWQAWRRGGAGGAELEVSTRPLIWHSRAIALVLALTVASGVLLATGTDAALPWLDALTTWGAIVATWMTARKLLESWVWWFIIDGLAMGLYFSRGLYLTVALFGLYLVLVVFGYRRWRQTMLELAA